MSQVNGVFTVQENNKNFTGLKVSKQVQLNKSFSVFTELANKLNVSDLKQFDINSDGELSEKEINLATKRLESKQNGTWTLDTDKNIRRSLSNFDSKEVMLDETVKKDGTKIITTYNKSGEFVKRITNKSDGSVLVEYNCGDGGTTYEKYSADMALTHYGTVDKDGNTTEYSGKDFNNDGIPDEFFNEFDKKGNLTKSELYEGAPEEGNEPVSTTIRKRLDD